MSDEDDCVTIDVRARGIRCRILFDSSEEIDRILGGLRTLGIGIGPDGNSGRTGAASLRRTHAELTILLHTIGENVDPEKLPGDMGEELRGILTNAPRNLRDVIALIDIALVDRVINGANGDRR